MIEILNLIPKIFLPFNSILNMERIQLCGIIQNIKERI